MNFPTGSAHSSVLRVEQISPEEVRADHDYTYQVRVSNLTDRPLQNVVLRSSKPDGFKAATAADGSPAAQVTNTGLSYNVGALAPHEVRVFTVTSTAHAQGVVRQTYDVTYQQQMAAEINVTAPALAFTKVGPSDVEICQGIDWTYTVKNTGSGVLRNVALRDPLPEGLATTPDGQNVVAANLGDIPAGESRNVLAHLKAVHTGAFASAATATSDVGTVKSAAVTTNVRQPKLDVTVKGPEREFLGKPVRYLVTVTNTGDAGAQNAAVRFDAPATAKMISCVESGAAPAAADAPPAGSIGTLAPGQAKTLDVVFQPTEAGALKISAIASAKCADQVARPAETAIVPVAALLLEAVDAQDPVKVGDDVVYNIKVTNQGNGADTNIKVTATIPDGEQFVKASGTTEAAANGQTVTFAPVASLAPKTAVSWQVTVKAMKGGDVRFKVTATSDAVKEPAEKIEPTKLY